MEIQKVLVIGGYHAPQEIPQIHYSGTKDINLAIGFKQFCSSVFVTSSKINEEVDGIHFMPLSDMSFEFFDSFDLIIFTREQFFEGIIKRNSELERFIFDNDYRRTFIACRMGSSSWMDTTRWTRKELYNVFDLIMPQTPSFVAAAKQKFNGDPDNKIYPSAMAVPMSLPKKLKCPFKKSKCNLIYMGRMRHNPSRMPSMIHIMNLLGNDFHLNILPGTFSKPNMINGRNKFGPENEINFNWLKDYFSEAKNITVHNPVEWGEHWNWLQNSDYALDFSPNPKAIKHSAGNAKLLEYMAAGLPVIVEYGPGNLELVTQSNGGIVIDRGSDANKYADGIIEALKTKFDRSAISKHTIRNHNWSVRSKEILDLISEIQK